MLSWTIVMVIALVSIGAIGITATYLYWTDTKQEFDLRYNAFLQQIFPIETAEHDVIIKDDKGNNLTVNQLLTALNISKESFNEFLCLDNNEFKQSNKTLIIINTLSNKNYNISNYYYEKLGHSDVMPECIIPSKDNPFRIDMQCALKKCVDYGSFNILTGEIETIWKNGKYLP